MKIKHSLAALVAIATTACSSDAPDNVNKFPDDNIIRVTTTINDVIGSRATSTYTGDNFALYISPKGVENAYTYKNVWFSQSDSQWKPTDGSEMRWQNSTTEYEYSAYAPASGDTGSALENNLLGYDLSTNNIDLLWAHNSGLASTLASSGAINIVFDHIFCRFIVDLEVGNSCYLESTSNPVSVVSFTNATGAGKFNVKTGEISETSEVEIFASAGTHVAGTLTTDGRYTTGGDYMAPGNQSVQVLLEVNGVVYSYTHPAYNFEAGKSYTLKIKVGESSVNAKGITVGDWSTGGSSDISTH